MSANTAIYPILRKAIFSKPDKSINKRNAEKIAEAMKNNWDEDKKNYFNLIRNSLPDSITEIEEEKTVRISNEREKAIIVDRPEIIIKIKNYCFNIRITSAICYDKFSTKNWTRIKLGKEFPQSRKNIDELNRLYSIISDKLCKYSHDITRKFFNENLQNDVRSVGNITIISCGIKDYKLGKQLEKFDNLDLEIKEFFTNKDAKNLIEKYYKEIFNIDNIEINKKSYNNFWFTSPINIENESGYIDNENVLYNFKQKNNNLFAFGIGYDNSSEKILAKLSSLKIARLITEEI
jgi:hypothetical protein